MQKGCFIVFEGPNGVGKTTVMDSVCSTLEIEGIPFQRTKEPTTSDLGKHIRGNQNRYSKEVLACLVAANRYEHLQTVILPGLQSGNVVLSDRYFPSSLVYQMMDGLDLSFVEDLNQRILIPSLTIFLRADPILLEVRLKERDNLTRFEQDQKKEAHFYNNAETLLIDKGWNILSLDSGVFNVTQLAERILRAIGEKYKS